MDLSVIKSQLKIQARPLKTRGHRKGGRRATRAVTPDDCGRLFFENKAFQKFVNDVVTSPESRHFRAFIQKAYGADAGRHLALIDGETHYNGKKIARKPGYKALLMQRWVAAESSEDDRLPHSYTDAVRTVCQSVARICNAVSPPYHPSDVADYAQRTILHPDNRKRKAASPPPEVGKELGLGHDVPNRPAAVEALIEALRNGDMTPFTLAAEKLEAADPLDNMFAFRAKPWQPPTKTNRALGVEIVSFDYSVPVAFDAHGNPTKWVQLQHDTAARRAEQVAGDDTAFYRALMQRTIAGRLWLCWTPDGKHVWLATDRKPRKSMYVTDARDPFVSALYDLGDDDHTFSGFIM